MADEDQTTTTAVAEPPEEEQNPAAGQENRAAESGEQKAGQAQEGEVGNAPKSLQVGSDGINIGGHRVVIFNMAVDDGQSKRRGWKAKSKSKVAIFGKGLDIYTQAFVRIKGSNWDVYRGVNFTRSDIAPVFYLPDLGQLYGSGAKIYLELYNPANPQATIRIRPFLKYQAEEAEEGEEKGKGKKGAEGKGEGQIGKTIGETLGGIFGIKKKLLDALKSNDKQAIKDAINLAKEKGDSQTLQDALKYAKEYNLDKQQIQDIEKALAHVEKNFKPSKIEKPPYDEGDLSKHEADDEDIEKTFLAAPAAEEAAVAAAAVPPEGGGEAPVKLEDRHRVQAQAGEIRPVEKATISEALTPEAEAAIAGGPAAVVAGEQKFQVRDIRKVQAQEGEIRQVGEVPAATGVAGAVVQAKMQAPARPEIKITDKRRVIAETQVQAPGGGVVSGTQAAAVAGGGKISIEEKLSAEGKIEGRAKVAGGAQAQVSQAVSGQAGVEAEGTVAGQAKAEIGGAGIAGQIKREVTVSGEAPSAGAAGKAEVTEKKEVEIQAQVPQAPAGGGGEVGVQAKITAAAGAVAAGAGGQVGAGGLSLSQSAGIVGEYLSKNPSLISLDPKVQAKVLQALKTGNLDGLDAEGRVALKQVLRQIPKQAPNDQRLGQAGQNLNQELTKEPEETEQAPAKREEGAGQPEPPSVARSKALAEIIQKRAADEKKRKEAERLGEAKPPIKPPKGLGKGPGMDGVGRGLPGAGVGIGGGVGPGLRQQLALEQLEQVEKPPGPPSGPPGKEEHLVPTAPPPLGPGGGEPPGGEAPPQEGQVPGGPEGPPEQGEEEAGPSATEEPEGTEIPQAGGKAEALDKEIQAIAKIVNPMLNTQLNQAAIWVWASALPSFGLSIIIGALAGDIILFIKNWVIKTFLKNIASKLSLGTLLKINVNLLKEKSDEIASHIKISGTVKGHILAMNAIVAAFIFLVVLIIMSVFYIGCHYPTSGKLSVLSLAGYSSICESLESGFLSVTGSFGGGGASGGLGSGTCSAAPSGPASTANLSSTCFDGNAFHASAIAFAESGGLDSRPSGVDKCLDQNGNVVKLNSEEVVVSWGLFQINLTAHKMGSLNCPAAFDKMYTAQNHQCQVTDPGLYASCKQAAIDAQTNIQVACQISSNGQTWSAWGANKKCGF
jgi:hypothetical protein